MWAKAVKYASDNGIKISEHEAKRSVSLSSALANSIVMCAVGQRRRDNDVCDESAFQARYFEIIDITLVDLEKRFTESDDVLSALCAFDPHSKSLLSVELLNSLATKFESLLHLNLNNFESQAVVAKNMFLNDTPCDTLQMYEQLVNMHCAFPDLLALFRLALTVPVASASAERSFSAMRRIKTHLRASTSASRTSDIALLAVERELSNRIMKDPSVAIDAFAVMGKRRLTLV